MQVFGWAWCILQACARVDFTAIFRKTCQNTSEPSESEDLSGSRKIFIEKEIGHMAISTNTDYCLFCLFYQCITFCFVMHSTEKCESK